MSRSVVVGACITALAAGVGAQSASAAFPGQNGQIAFLRSMEMQGVVVAGADGQGETLIAPDGELPAFSPDGELIAFNRFDGTDQEIFVVGAGGEGLTQLTDNDVDDTRPAFSPDGQRIAFVRPVGADTEIFLMGVDGQNPIQLTDNALGDSNPTFFPNAQRIAFNRFEGDNEIFVMDVTGQNATPLTDNAVQDRDPNVSPDGALIAFRRLDGGDDEIVVMEAGGQNQVPLTDNAVFDSAPAFSPDGSRIAFTHFDGSDTEIFVMDASGQSQAPVTSNAVADSDPDWQPLNPPTLDLSGPAKQKSVKTIAVTVVSQNEDATATLGGTIRVPKIKKGAAQSKSKTIALPGQTVELQPAQPVVVELSVPGKARKLLKRALRAGKKGRAEITATATDDLGAPSADQHALKLKKKSKKK